jgi:hypothetical protein
MRLTYVRLSVCTVTPGGSGGRPRFSRSFAKDALGHVHLRGIAFAEDGTGGDGKCDSTQPGEAEDGLVFSLPAGYRPDYVTISAAVAQIAIVPDAGAVLANSPMPPGAVYAGVSSVAGLDDASFSAATAAATEEAKTPARVSLDALRIR